MLSKHEKAAIDRYRQGGDPFFQRRRLVRVNLASFGLPGFHDVFAVRMRTDIMEKKAYTSFLARPGVVFVPNAASFFSGQCDGPLSKRLVRAIVGTSHQLLEWGVLTAFRLNITEMDATSSVCIGNEAISTSDWSQKTRELHRKKIGRSFAEPHLQRH